MLKLIRKYRQWALGVIGVLLMVTFLFGGIGPELFGGDPNKAVVARLDSAKVTRGELTQYEIEYEILKEYVPELVQSGLGIENGVHWMLLVHEAKKAGLVGEAGDGDAWLEDLAEFRLVEVAAETVRGENPGLANFFRSDPRLLRSLAVQKLNDAEFRGRAMAFVRDTLDAERARLAAKAGLTIEGFNVGLARLRGVDRLIRTFTDANSRLSDLQFISGARDLYEPAAGEAVIIRASRLLPEIPEPTAERVRAHYEQFRSVAPGTPPHGFGYIQPSRVKLEWLEFKRADVAGAIALDPVAVQKHYQRNREKYPGEFGAERARIESELRGERTDEIMAQIDAVYKARVKSATRRLEVADGVKVLPADWEEGRPKMSDLGPDIAQAVREATGVAVPAPNVTVSAVTWTRLDQAGSLPGIGQAVFTSGSRQAGLAELLASLHELNVGAGGSGLGLQNRVPFDTALQNAAGDRYYLTVLDWRKESSPDSLEEVQDTVVRDIKTLEAYEKLKGELGKYRALAVSDGLEAVGKLFEKTGEAGMPAIPVTKNVMVTRQQSRPAMPELQDQAFRDAVLAAAEALGRTATPTADNAEARTIAAELPATLSVVVMQLGYPMPLTEETMRTVRREQVQDIAAQEWRAVLTPEFRSPFSLEKLKERSGYQDVAEKSSGGAPQPAA